MNVNITCHKHEIYIVMWTRSKMGKGSLEEEVWGKGWRFKIEMKLYYIHVPTSQDDCKQYVIQTCTTNKKSKWKITSSHLIIVLGQRPNSWVHVRFSFCPWGPLEDQTCR